MEPIQLKTPSGYTVFLRPFLTFGQRRELEKVWASKLKVDADAKRTEFDASAIYEAEDLAVSFLVEKILDKDGNELAGKPLETILSWPDEDGRCVYDKINEIASIKPSSQEKKK